MYVCRDGGSSLEASIRLPRLSEDESLTAEDGERLRREVAMLREEVTALKRDLDRVRQTREEMAKLYRQCIGLESLKGQSDGIIYGPVSCLVWIGLGQDFMNCSLFSNIFFIEKLRTAL
jgi:hypothetical protein